MYTFSATLGSTLRQTVLLSASIKKRKEAGKKSREHGVSRI
jgi:hypothetical protein